MLNQPGRGAKGWHLPARHGQLYITPALLRDGAGTNRQSLGRCPGAPAASAPTSQKNPSALPGAACESRPPLPACRQPGRERAALDSTSREELNPAHLSHLIYGSISPGKVGGLFFFYFPFSFPRSTPSRDCRAGLLVCSHGSIPR